MIVYMPKRMLAGYTKFIPLWNYIIRIHVKRIRIHSLPLGWLKADIRTRKYYEKLAEKYCPYPSVKLTEKDLEWAQAIAKDLGLY